MTFVKETVKINNYAWLRFKVATILFEHVWLLLNSQVRHLVSVNASEKVTQQQQCRRAW